MNCQISSNMYGISYKPTFVRQYKKLSPELKNDVKKVLDILKENPSHPFLKTHKLQGKLQGVWSCSANYSHRILFEYEDEGQIVCLAVGNHDVYR